MIKIENLMRIISVSVVVPLWSLVMYEGIIKGGFKVLDSIIIT